MADTKEKKVLPKINVAEGLSIHERVDVKKAPKATEEEWFDVVDENDTVVGKATRRDCHTNNRLIHRSSHIFVVNPEGKIFLHKRSESKDMYPGFWDSSVSGHVNQGETYREAAVRELGEEAPNVEPGLEKIGLFQNYTDDQRENTVLFMVRHNGEVDYNKEEAADGRFLGVGELKEAINGKTMDFTPGFIVAFRMYCKSTGQ